ncbi:MAG: toll/interleukin-1 receptor domain-containing protein [Pseudomonadota bacterium]
MTTPFLFLSYSSQDRDFACGLLGKLETWDLPYWWDQHIEPGEEWRTKVQEQLEKAAVILTLWTKDSAASKAVIEEASTAQGKRKLVHVRLDDSDIPYGFKETQYVDLRDWHGSDSHPTFQRLIYALRDKLTVPTVSFATSRIRESSPVEAVVVRGRLVLKDAPANAPAAQVNPVELKARLTGLRQTVGSMCQMCADNTVYQSPPTLHQCLEAIQTASKSEPVTWYALEDAKTMLQDCMADNFATES